MRDSLPVLAGNLALGRYRVVKELARGGMGMVYLGRIEGAAGFSKPVVVKRVLSQIDESEGSRSQFIREARLLSELHHPNIVGVLDFGQEGGSYLMVLEYVHGYHVGHWLKYVRLTRGQLEWELGIYVLTRVLSALHYAHTRMGPDGRMSPIIHRDVSPGNVLIDLQGNVRLLDFGIARVSDDADELRTQEGIVKGKLPYIAPEMYQSAEASVASDVYAAGVMLYQLLAGKNPFAGKDMSAIVTRVLQHTPPPISSMRDDVPPELDEVVSRAIAKNPKDRFATAQAFSHALSALLESPEPEVCEDLRVAVSADFTGALPEMLGLPALSDLDSAWRASASNPAAEQSLQRSSLPPGDEDATAVVAVPQGLPLTEDTYRELTTGSRQGGLRGEPTGAPLASAASTPNTTRTIVVSTLGAGLLAGAIAAAALLFGQRSNSAGQTQRYLLVERPSSGEQTPGVSSAPGPSAPSPAESGDSAPAPNVDSASADSGRDPKALASTPTPTATGSAQPSDAEKLTRAFARRQGAVQQCFTSSAGELEGSPEVSVHFRIGESGQVQAATLSPSALAGTSLGQCLLGVARNTQFPRLGKVAAFSIPITARVVK